MEDVILYYGREIHWRIVFNKNDGRVDDQKYILRAKRWDLYMDDKKAFIRGGYYV